MTHLDLTDLPHGKVTLINAASPGSDLDAADHLDEAMTDALTTGTPVVYVKCGGHEGWTTTLAAQVGPNPLLHVLDDEDDVVWLPNLAPDEPDNLWTIGTPTFARVDRALRAHAEAIGPSVLILDAIEWARPYAGIDEHPSEAATLIQDYLTNDYLTAITPTQVRRWRANDLQRLTRRYPNTRILAITYNETVAERLAAATIPLE